MNKSSCDMMWDLLNPSPSFKNCWDSFRSYWNTLTIARQRQIYYTIREQKNRGEYIKEHPLYAIQDCNPVPTNWNGRQGINERMKSEKMVIAKYSSTYGSYTLFEAWLFEMKDAVAANFFPENLFGREEQMFNAIRRK